MCRGALQGATVSLTPLNYVTLILYLVGIGWLLSLYPQCKREWRTRRWKLTTGKVIHSELQEFVSTAGEGTDSEIIPRIVYEYSVSGEKFFSGRITKGSLHWYGIFGAKSETYAARRFIDQYSIGDEIDVWYNPRNPEDAVLVPGLSQDTIAKVVAGIGFLVVFTLEILG